MQRETQPHVYQKFIEIMKKQENQEMDIEQIKISVQEILADYPTLLEEFKAFIPEMVSFNAINEARSVQKPNKPPESRPTPPKNPKRGSR